MLAAALTIIQPANAAVPDRKAWVLWNQTAGTIIPTGTWPAPSSVIPIAFGRYQLKFPGQGAPGGVVHVTAINNAPHWCQAENWFQSGPDEIVNIRCYRAGGALDVTSFSAFFVSASGGPAPGCSGTSIRNRTAHSSAPTTPPVLRTPRRRSVSANGR